MLKKIRKAYNDKAFVAALSVVLMVSPYPIISGWMYGTFGFTLTLCYFIVILVLMLCHAVFLVTTMFPRFYVPDDEELKAAKHKDNIERAFDEAHFLK